MPENFNPTEWITTKEAAELTGYNLEYMVISSRRKTPMMEDKTWIR